MVPDTLSGWVVGASVVTCIAASDGARAGHGVVFRPAGVWEVASANRVKDPGFEHVGTDRTDWKPFGEGFEVDREVRYEGRQSIRCRSADAKRSLGATRTFELNHDRVVPVRVAVRSRCEGVGGNLGDYCIWVDIIHTDGAPTWGLIKRFSPGTHDWERKALTILPPKPIGRMFVHCLFRKVQGTAWFDDAAVWIADDARVRVFDGEPVALVAEDAAEDLAAETTSVIAAGDGGVGLRFERATGRILAVVDDGKPLAPGALPGGVLVQDAGRRGPVHRVMGPLEVEAGRARQRVAVERLGLEVTTTYRAEAGRLRGRVDVRSGREMDRALSVAIALPVRAVGWWWHEDARRRQRIAQGRTYCNAARLGVGKTGTSSRYPLAAISNGEVGLAVAVPLDEPRVMRLSYDAEHGWLLAAFDTGVSPAVEKLANGCRAEFEVFAFDPEWGFRAGLQRYHEQHAPAFARRVKDVGLWMAFAKISEVERPKDFGFLFKEGLGDQAYDNAHGILTFRYTEPQSHWMPMPKGMERSYDQAVKLMEQRAGEQGRKDRLRYQAVLTSGAKDAEGRYHVTMHDTPWCDGAVFALNPDPDIAGPVNKAQVNYNPSWAVKLYADDAAHGIDGEYLDSLDGWSTQQNYRREHLAKADVPPVFDTESRRLCLVNAFSIWEFVRWVSAQVHGRGKLMMANYTPTRYPWQVPHIDVMGQETNWNPGGTWRPMSDEELCYRRALCATKPYLLLQNSDFTTWTQQHTRWYVMRAGAYGVLPSFFSANASTDHYFQKPAWYNRDRAVFRELIPVIRRVAWAGWRPITYARIEPAGLQVERFGDADGAEVFLTVHNPTEKDLAGGLKLDREIQAMRAEELVTKRELSIVPSATTQATDANGSIQAIAVMVPARATVFVRLARAK